MATVGALIRALLEFPLQLEVVNDLIPGAPAEVGPVVRHGSVVMLTAGREAAREAKRWADVVREVVPGQLTEDPA